MKNNSWKKLITNIANLTQRNRIFKRWNTIYVNTTVKERITSTSEHFSKESTTNKRNIHHQITVPEQEREKFYWSKILGSIYENDLSEAYKQRMFYQ